MINNNFKLKYNCLNIKHQQKKQIFDIVDDYYRLLDDKVQSIKDKKSFEYESELPGYLIAIGEGCDLFADQQKWIDNAYTLLSHLKTNIKENPDYPISFFYGLSEIAYGTMIISTKTGHFNRFLSSLNVHMSNIFKQHLAQIDGLNGDTRMECFDVIFGFAGIGRYLLSYVKYYKMYQDCEVEETMLKKIIKYFIELSEDKIVNGKKIVKFHVSSQNQFTEDEKIAYPNGNLDFGIAHGMAGPLALMSYAVQNGVVIDGQIDAIKKLIRLYDTHSFYEDQILRWPTILSFDNYWEKDVSVNRYDKKMGWCYGSIGISRVLYIASQCVELESLKYLDNLKKISQLPINKFNLVSPTLCHGYAGVLSILNLTYKENPKLVEMKKGIDSNLHQILKCYDPSLKYGFRNVEFYETGLIEDESNTYLSGTTGIVLTLLSLLQSDSRHEEHLMIK